MDPLQVQLAKRRKELGIPYPALAARSGVSIATAKRILSGQFGSASFDHVAAIARAMGLSLGVVEEISATDFREEAARQQARRLVRMVQGTAGLESQAVDDKVTERLVRESVHRLMAGSPRRVWAS